MKCQRCQFENTADSIYCSKCGTSLGSRTEPVDLQSTRPYTPVHLDLEIGSLFAERYQILEELGSGGMGKVYKVMDKEVKEKIAIKVLRPEISLDEKIIERFRNELKMARKISHPNICRMYDLVKERGLYFITMEYVSGEDLKSTILRVGQLSVGKSLAIIREICKGLSEAHKMGIVHRDLKPHNIIIDRDGDVRIMDFGIAHSLTTRGMTEPGVLIGTPEYLSPEQAVGEEADHRSDIYSLGVILFECLTGAVPFKSDSAVGVALKHKSEPPPNPRSFNSQIPEDVSQMILRCLEKQKEKRYQNVGQILEDISRILKGQPTTERIVPAKPQTTAGQTGTPKPRFRVALLASALVLVAGIAGILAYRIIRSDGAAPRETWRLDIKSKPSGAIVYVDEQPIGETRLKRDLDPGTYQLRISKDGYRNLVETVKAEKGGHFFREYVLEPVALSPLEYGQIDINSLPPGAKVYLGVGEKGTTPTGPISVPTGKHKLRLALDDYEEISMEIDVEIDKPYSEVFELVRSSQAPTVPSYSVRVDSEPRDANISVYEAKPDGTTGWNFRTKTPGTITSNESTIRLKINKADNIHEPWEGEISLIGGPIRKTLAKKKYEISLETSPSEADIFIGGSHWGKSPKTATVDAGIYKIRFELEGHEPREISRTVNRKMKVEETLTRLETVKVELRAMEMFMDIFIDGQAVLKAVDKRPSVILHVTVGEHLIEFLPENREKIATRQMFKAGNEYRMICYPSKNRIDVIEH